MVFKILPVLKIRKLVNAHSTKMKRSSKHISFITRERFIVIMHIKINVQKIHFNLSDGVSVIVQFERCMKHRKIPTKQF